MAVLITCKNEEDPTKIEGASFFEARGQLIL